MPPLKGVLEGALAIGVGMVVIGSLVPMGLDAIYNTTTTGWNSAVATIFTVLLPILAVVGLGLYFLPRLKG